MAQYLLFHLNNGKHGQKQILSVSNTVQMQTPQMALASGIRFSELGHTSYGMGWYISAYRGHKLVQHGGGIDGFISLLNFLPQEKIGVMVLTNLSPNPLTSIVTHYIFDRLLGLDQVTWSERFKKDQQRSEDAEDEAKQRGLTTRKPGTKPSRVLEEYAAQYEHPGYGHVKIDVAGEDLELAFNRMVSPLRHYHYDVFEVPDNPLDPIEHMKVQFHSNLSGDIEKLSMILEPSVLPVFFARLPDSKMREISFLQPFVGEYQLASAVASVSLKGEHALAWSLPGQSVRELVPQRGTTFSLEGTPAVRIEFRRNASDTFNELVLYSPGRTIVARKK